ncbi:TPA: hypothetical protein ACH3X2_004885 [Trebouxia sp. C0005]
MQFLTQKGGQHLRLLQLVDQLIMPGIKEGRVQANMLPQDNREQRQLRQDCKKHLEWLHARNWTFFALAALYYPTQKQHRIFKDHPFFQNEEAVRLFEELWIPLVRDSFTTGAKVYLHLCGPNGKHLLHAAKMQPGLAKLPSNNAEKRQLLGTLVTLIDSNHHNAYVMPGPAAKPEDMDTEHQTLFLQQISADPLPFNLPAEFRSIEERHPRWEASKLADQWLKRRDLAFEVCIQASALQQVANARAAEVERGRQEEHRQNKKKFVAREASMDLRAAADKVAALLQAAIQTNKKTGCHPQTIETLSRMFKDLRSGQQEAKMHRSNGKNMPPSSMPASSLQGWLCTASSSDIDAMVADLYA